MSAPFWFKRGIRVVANDLDRDTILHAQRVMRIPESGTMDEKTISSLRGIQMLFNLPVTGMLDEATAEELERIRNYWSAERGD